MKQIGIIAILVLVCVAWLFVILALVFRFMSIRRSQRDSQREELRRRALGMPATELVCSLCGKRFSRIGMTRSGQRALGGVKCRSCGNFYCEACVARAVSGKEKTMQCRCGKARAPLGDDGSLRFDGFEELVVYPRP